MLKTIVKYIYDIGVYVKQFVYSKRRYVRCCIKVLFRHIYRVVL